MYMWNQVNCTKNHYANIGISSPYNQWSYLKVSCPHQKGDMLNAAGRTALVKATMSAIPIHMAITLCLSPWAIQAIDKLRRGFIWSGSDSAAAGRCKVAWESRPRELGGLGISDLRWAGVALWVR